MALTCVHHMAPEQCSRCRTCPHGLMTSQCSRCANAVLARAAAKAMPPAQAPEEHRGYEIFFVPEERSWYYRDDPDAPLPAMSYRSAFQARRAIDEALDAPPEPAKPEPARKRK